MKKRYFSIFMMIILIACLMLSACKPDTQKGDLTILGRASDTEKPYLTKIVDLYERSTGKDVKLISYEDNKFEAEAARLFDRGEGPDILLHFNNADLHRFDKDAFFVDLLGQSWNDELTDSARNYCMDEEGRLLGLPFWESSVSGCYYNKTLFDKLGLKPATTQAEFNTLCEALKTINKTPVCWPADGCTWMFQFGLDPIFADDPKLLERLNNNEISYADIPAVKKMVEWINKARTAGWFGSDCLETGWDQISAKLSSGEAAMTFIWDTWFYTDFKSGRYTRDDFALMPVFMDTVEGGTFEGGNLNMMMVNNNGLRTETALEFLAFCAAPENYNVAFENISTVSCFKNQTTNIQSKMVTDAASLIASKERVSTAATKIIGYSADEVANAFLNLFYGRVNVDGCIRQMDNSRISLS